MKKEKTLVLIKPDGVQRSLIGEIIRRYERTGLKIVGLKMVVLDEDFVRKHYTVDPEWFVKTGMKTIESYHKKGKTPPSDDPKKITEIVLNNLVKFMTSGPVIAMVWQGVHSVGIVKKITGGTEPLTSDMGTIRGDLTIDSYELSDADKRAIRNLVHCSGTTSDAEKEIKLWFKPAELIDYRLNNEAILYDANLEGIFK